MGSNPGLPEALLFLVNPPKELLARRLLKEHGKCPFETTKDKPLTIITHIKKDTYETTRK
jgi:hypothetical protein